MKQEVRCAALILAGGSGTRFWPLSRRLRPKQLLALVSQDSLLQGTVRRLEPLISQRDVFCCTTLALADQVSADLRVLECAPESTQESSLERRVLAEPLGRNTAPAIAWAVDRIAQEVERDEGSATETVVVVLPSDHLVEDPMAFREALAVAIEEARVSDRIVTLGVPPRWAETGYGYLELESVLGEASVYDVARFTEKPSLENARTFAEGGRHLWNAGIFVFRVGVFQERVARHLPEISSLLEELRLAPAGMALEIYQRMPSISIDYGLMEHLEDTAAVPLDCGWNDLGSWDALADVLVPDAVSNRTLGDVVCVDSNDNLVVAAEGTVAVVGVENLIVVRTGDSVLVMPRGRAQDVRQVVAELERSAREELL